MNNNIKFIYINSKLNLIYLFLKLSEKHLVVFVEMLCHDIVQLLS